jgi:hypothetical protein
VWNRPIGDVVALGRWIAGLSPAVTHGDMPTQAELDTWARDHTYGLIEKFPLTVTAETVVLLATALATKVSWRLPFDAGAGGRAGLRAPGPAGGAGAAHARSSTGTGSSSRRRRRPATWRCTRRTPSRRARRAAPLPAAAGDVGDRRGRRAAATMLAEAHRIARMVAFNEPVTSTSLFDLPLGESPLWTIEEAATMTSAPDGREERSWRCCPRGPSAASTT